MSVTIPEMGDLSPRPWNRALLPVSCLLASTAAAAWFACALRGVGLDVFEDSYILPWVGLVLFVICAPSLLLAARNRFDLFHPLVYPVWSYLFPAFVLGSLYLATGRSESFILGLIPDRREAIPLALICVAAGFAGLSLGYAVPWARRIGIRLRSRLPAWDYDADRIVYPALAVFFVGKILELVAFSTGVVGYQIADAPALFGHTYYYFSLLGSMANVILWFALFRTRCFRLRHYLAAAVLVCAVPYSMVLWGSKGDLLKNLIAILFAYSMSGRVFRPRHWVAFGLLLALAVLGGTAYGTLFRMIKGGESRVGIAEYAAAGVATLGELRQSDVRGNLGLAAETALNRFETTSSVAVIVANRDRLQPFEADYGIENSTWTYTWTAFIPRFLWPGKPLISNARAVAALYFEFEDSSFAITPMADLLRDLGPIAVPVGMAVLGFFLRVMHASLAEGGGASAWRTVSYFLLLYSVSYEGFYGTIFPGLIRVFVVLLVGGYLLETRFLTTVFIAPDRRATPQQAP